MIKLNLGCGRHHIPGYINVDIDDRVLPDKVCSVSNLAFVQDGSVEHIVAHDIIEHFDRTQIPGILKHWYDKLAPGGILQIRTNDVNRLVRMYVARLLFGVQNEMNPELFIWHLMCEHEKPGMGHKWAFTVAMMFRYLSDAGFFSKVSVPDSRLAAGDYQFARGPDLTNMVVIAFKYGELPSNG